MNYGVILSIVLIVLLIWFTLPNTINQTELDSKIVDGWWIGSSDFLQQADLKYLFMNFETTIDGSSLNTFGYVIAGDDEGILYNTPVKMNLTYGTQTDDMKGVYNISLESTEKLPFPNNSTLILDRSKSSLSVYKDSILYIYCSK
jgi:hypothetical protein